MNNENVNPRQLTSQQLQLIPILGILVSIILIAKNHPNVIIDGRPTYKPVLEILLFALIQAISITFIILK